MRRVLTTPRALIVLALSVLAGAGVGIGGHALADDSPPSAGSSGPASPRQSGASELLGSGNVLATDDFTAVGWDDVAVDVLADGEPQYLYSCERRQLSTTGFPGATIDADWNRQQSLTAAETVAQLPSPPQATSLATLLTRWYDDCTPGRPGSGPVTPSTSLGSVTTAHGTARIWRVGSAADRTPTYAIVALDGDRLGLVDLYSDLTPPDPAGLRELAQSAVDRLG